MTTTRDLIQSSLRLINIAGAGENMTPEDAVDGLATLNQLLSSWSADGKVIYSRSVDTKALSGGVQSYTMGVGGDINTTRPVSITQATLTLGGVVTPIEIWAQETFSVLSLPTLQGGIPYQMFVNNGNPLVTLQLWPIPSSGQTLTLYSIKPLSTLALNDTLDLPPGYERALRYNLAVEFAPEYEREASATVKDVARESLGTIMRNNQQYQPPTMVVDSILYTSWYDNWGFNIYSGV
jgi:hypothetical protein